MIFGDKEQFAIECIIDTKNSNQKYTFGNIAIWIGREQLGQLSLIVVLEIPISHFQASLNDCGKRKEEKFQKMNGLEVFNFLMI
ncbi:MAG: Imm42 family immunity protein, partial [Waterburya sp.]